MKTLNQIKQIISSNLSEGLEKFNGLLSDEIGAYNRAIMFGENDEAFPCESELQILID